MKRLISLLCLMVLLVPPAARAASIEPEAGPARKIQRGFVNMVLAPSELFHEIAAEKEKDDMIPGWFVGFGRGIGFTAIRCLAGLYEVVTFALPVPANYAPVIRPEFPWELAETDGKVEPRF